jgi:NADH dehydrogenase FAD-containing subunit
MTNYESRLRVLVAGAGVAGLETALALQALAPEVVSVVLVAPETEFTYRPLAVTEPFRLGEVRRFPLEPLARAAGAQLRRGMLTAVDPEQKLVTLDPRTRVAPFSQFRLPRTTQAPRPDHRARRPAAGRARRTLSAVRAASPPM